MGLLNKIFGNTKKPVGLLGKMMAQSMNSGHAKLADWGMQYLPAMEPKMVCDYGCGGGRNVGVLLKSYPKAKVYGMDYSEVSVTVSKQYNAKAIEDGRCIITQGNVADIPFEEGMFDIATAFETVYFWPGIETCFAGVYRTLKQNGYFLIVNEADGLDTSSDKWTKIIDGMKVYNANQLEEALRTAGFQEIKGYHHDTKPWIAILAKK